MTHINDYISGYEKASSSVGDDMQKITFAMSSSSSSKAVRVFEQLDFVRPNRRIKLLTEKAETTNLQTIKLCLESAIKATDATGLSNRKYKEGRDILKTAIGLYFPWMEGIVKPNNITSNSSLHSALFEVKNMLATMYFILELKPSDWTEKKSTKELLIDISLGNKLPHIEKRVALNLLDISLRKLRKGNEELNWNKIVKECANLL